jgi:hypothetical protein
VRKHRILALAAVLLVSSVTTIASAAPKEYRIKAAYLVNFVKFIQWPDAAFAGGSAPVAICVLGEDRFEGLLEKGTSGKKFGGRSAELKSLASGSPGASAKGCQLLFVSSSESSRRAEIFAELAGTSVVTVGEGDGFAAAGGVFNFVNQGDKIKVEFNAKAAEANGVKVSAQLQQVMVAVTGN